MSEIKAQTETWLESLDEHRTRSNVIISDTRPANTDKVLKVMFGRQLWMKWQKPYLIARDAHGRGEPHGVPSKSTTSSADIMKSIQRLAENLEGCANNGVNIIMREL